MEDNDAALQEFPEVEEIVPQKTYLTSSRLIFRFVSDFLIAILIGVVFFLPLYFLVRETEYELLFGAFFTQIGLLIVCLFRMRRFRKIQQPLLPMFEGPMLPALRWGLIGGIVFFVLNVLHGIMMDQIVGIDVAEKNPWMSIEDFSTAPLIATLLVGGIMAPFVEEIFLRGVMFGAFAALGHKTTGIVFTVLLFIFLHLDPINTLAYAMLGLGFLWVYIRTRNLASAILAHILNNSLGFFFILWPI
ncbi:MAG: CPBP family intramembrane metalloprotease [Candidatus Omnitrophica bacterium]|nr:CPBP family intramembrane metalloprotease [Candidatus Omnitrophota bacterium]